jgi:hypothetical protein
VIYRINYKSALSVIEFINRVKDFYKDMYITKNKERIFLTDLNLIEKVLDTQEVYVSEDKEINGILLIYKEKGYRPYVKILAINKDSTRNLIKFLVWNFSEKDLFIKVKKENPILKIAQDYGFVFSGDRGSEILLFRKGVIKKNNYKLGEKDERNNN